MFFWHTLPNLGVEIEINHETGQPTGWIRHAQGRVSAGKRVVWNFINGELRLA